MNILPSLVQIPSNRSLLPDCIRKPLLELFKLSLHASLSISLMRDPQRSRSFLDRSIRRGTVWTSNDSSTDLVDSFGVGSSLHVFQVWLTESFEPFSTVVFGEKDSRASLGAKQNQQDRSWFELWNNTHLADILKDSCTMLEVAQMIHRQLQLYIREMSHTIL